MTVPDDAGIFPVGTGFLLAHQGGWDEILLVVGPLAVVGLLLWLANRRVTAQLDRAEGGGQSKTGHDNRDHRQR